MYFIQFNKSYRTPLVRVALGGQLEETVTY